MTEVRLHQGQITRGDGGPGFLSFSVDLTLLSADHPLKTDGVQTAGWTTFFYVKRYKDDLDSASIITKSNGVAGGLTASTASSGLINISPTESELLTINKAYFSIVISKNDGTARYTMEKGEFAIVDV